MDINIQVGVVYVDGSVRIYGEVPRDGNRRAFLRTIQFNTYGHALQYVVEFEQKQIDEYLKRVKKKL